ncbi:MAG: hypothetical protein J6D34_01780 [Atopobiaceae bacterium]|nr:hypothetical protein [Atopobiaceae bacterium]
MADEIERVDGSQHHDLGPHDDLDPRQGFGAYGISRRWEIGMGVAALVLAVISFFALAAYFSDPQTFAGTVAALDEKRDTVMSLVGASTGSSAAISLLPGDAGSAIAEKLVDLSADFLVVIAAIYLEKYLLTILGVAAFKFLVPIGLVLVAIMFLGSRRLTFGPSVGRLGLKLIVFGLAVFVAVPASIKVSGMIERTYEASINETIQTAEQTTDAIEGSAQQEGEAADAANPLSFLLQVPEELNKLTDAARNALNNFIEALAVMIVTSCIIPILVLVFFLWLAKLVLGIDIDLPMRRRRMR